MSERLENLAKAIGALAANTTDFSDEPESSEMSPDAFIEYATEQLEKAATDEPEVREERLKALGEQVAEIQKNFEGRPKTALTGVLKIKHFRDPAQVKTTEKTQGMKKQPMGDSNFSANASQPAVAGGAGSAPTGGLGAPKVAGGSGFESPGMATFAKALEDLGAALAPEAPAATEDEPPKAPEKAEKADEAPEGTDAPEGTEEPSEGTESVAKAHGADYWPLDMNTPHGRGEVEKADEPEWGRDPVLPDPIKS
jgi:hypothetical protein